MQLTEKQNEGLKIILQKRKDGEPYVVISGYAGSGKSTLIKFAIEAMDVDKDRVAYATLTGKAAEVLRQKGNKGAITLHKLLYHCRKDDYGNIIKTPKKNLDYDILVVDEVSMVPWSMIQTLLSHHIFTIFLGDPFQLPQIDEDEGHNLLDNADIFLDEIMRQAECSPIIQVATMIRQGKPVPYGQYGDDVLVITRNDCLDSYLLSADQIICATNRQRNELNNKVRQLKGYTGYLPNDGEKLICVKNDWNTVNENDDALVNGTTGIIHKPYEGTSIVPRNVYIREDHYIDTINGSLETEDGFQFYDLAIDKAFLLTGQTTLSIPSMNTLHKHHMDSVIPKQLEFGYAITAHKAQGSEWNKVIVFEDPSARMDWNEHARWLYTAVTRAIKKLILVR